ncbi:MAG: rhomboid family intramembrane serine protease [Planctomycetaceae bacterium]|nr:rhomboid family intramembrane serine protease [Planctomycetaceae bacterium]
MIPLRDDIPTRCVPFINYGLIVACVLVYLLEATSPDGGERIVFEYGMIPGRVTGQSAAATLRIPDPERGIIREIDAPPSAVAPWATMLTCMFLHGGLMHLAGNMLFLYIFGDNVEDRYGHFGYLLMYLVSGLAAGVLHIVTGPGSEIPTVGASGAIAGVMGAYLLMFPHARVMTLIPLGVFTQLVAVPAPFLLGIWFLMQLFSAAGGAMEAEGVAFWAHVGGFVAGLVLTWLLCQAGSLQPEREFRHVPAWQRRRVPWN